jgi:hypothetical protein
LSSDSLGAKQQPQFLDGGAPDLAVDQNLVANYAAKYGNYVVGPTAEQNAHSSTAWEGLDWYDTTLHTKFTYSGTAWHETGSPIPFTPVWTTSGTAPGLGNSTLAGEYVRQGKRVTATIYFQVGTASVSGGTGSWRFSLPFAAGTNNFGLVSGHALLATSRQPTTAVVEASKQYLTGIAIGNGTAIESADLAAGNSLTLIATYDVP